MEFVLQGVRLECLSPVSLVSFTLEIYESNKLVLLYGGFDVIVVSFVKADFLI